MGREWLCLHSRSLDLQLCGTSETECWWKIIKISAPQARPPRAAGAHEAYIGPDGSIHCVNEACMGVRSRALARRAGQTRELTSGFRARNTQHKEHGNKMCRQALVG